MNSSIKIQSATSPSQTAWGVLHAELRAILEAGMEPQELANRLGPVIDIIHDDLKRCTVSSEKPTCPKCGHRHRNAVSEVESRLWYCTRCNMMFDDDPDDGGDFDDRDPSRRLEREEARRARR